MVTKRLVPTVPNTRLLLCAPLGYKKKTCRDTCPCLSSFFHLPTQSSLLETLFIYGYYFQLKWIKQNESKIMQRINIKIIKLSFIFFLKQLLLHQSSWTQTSLSQCRNESVQFFGDFSYWIKTVHKFYEKLNSI